MQYGNRTRLANLPTPIQPLPRLSAQLGGPDIWIKRDDATGLALGGNKTRKLEFLVGEALAAGADTLITAGAAQSNHCRQTAAAAAACGLRCHLLLGGEAPSQSGQAAQGNLMLDQLLGASIQYCGNRRKGEALDEAQRTLEQAGRRPWIIPYGGSSPVGALGYVKAMRELSDQVAEYGIGFDRQLFATSSGGTQAGLLAGLRLCGMTGSIEGIQIDKDEDGSQSFREQVHSLTDEALLLSGSDAMPDASGVIIHRDMLAAGYGVVTDAEREAISLLAQLEGILLDPVYTGRAMAGLIHLIRNGTIGSDETVLFWHTGGAPALFSHAADLC